MATKKTYGSKKSSVRGKLSSAFKKAVLGGILLGALAGFGGYQYGTIQTAEIKVTAVQNNYLGWNSDKHASMYDYKIVTENNGTFNNSDSMLHLKFNSADVQGKMAVGKTYEIQYYGLLFSTPVINLSPNILSAKLITEDELKARADAAAAKASAEPSPAASQPAAQPPAGAESCLTGEVVTYTVVKNGYSLQITIPSEALGKVTVNTVKPVAAPAP